MRRLYAELEKKIDSLIDYNNAIKYLLNIPSEEFQYNVKKIFKEADGRIFHHDLIIVNTYGIVEWFTEQLIKAYLMEVSCLIGRFTSLPECIYKKHTSFSVDLLKNLERMGAKYQHLRTEDIIKNLYTCLFDEENFTINTDAFTYHSSNLRKDTIDTLFNNIGIEKITHKITEDKRFRNTLKEIEGEDDTGLDKYTEEKFYERLQELVERRNQIAHGVPSNDIFSTDELRSYIIYIKSFLEVMYSEVYKQFLRLVINGNKCICLGKPHKVFKGINVISFHSKHLTVRKRQLLIGYNQESDGVTYGYINSLRKETESGDVDIESISELEDIIIGIQTDAEGRDNYIYYLY